jgi:hypothetical protein
MTISSTNSRIGFSGGNGHVFSARKPTANMESLRRF